MSFPTSLKELCTPAFVYFTLSIIVWFIVLLQNFGNDGVYTIGNFSTDVSSTVVIFVFKLLYILFWTYILNLICKDGNKGLSWFLVIFPWLLLFVVIGILMISV
jgi:hypothetical protein